MFIGRHRTSGHPTHQREDPAMKDRVMDPGAGVFLQGLEDAASCRSLSSHPFYQLWSEGRLNRPILGEFAKQSYAHVRAFPTYLSAVHSQCGERRVRQTLLETLIEEERGEDNRAELWLRFAESLGLGRNETRSATLLPTTLESVRLMGDVTRRRDYREGVAALWAIEWQVPGLARIEREALQVHYGVSDPRPLAFFSAHEEAGVRRGDALRGILVSHCLTAESRSRVIQAVSTAGRTLWNFVDGLYAACVPEGIRGETVHN
jgi:pyrroloquinoline-quinone synthase